MKTPILFVTTLAALVASAALAQAPQAQAPSPDTSATPGQAAEQHSAPTGAVNDGLDPNEMICRSQQQIGSRLRFSRVCATRAQWTEQLRLERQYVEKAQTNRIWPGQ